MIIINSNYLYSTLYTILYTLITLSPCTLISVSPDSKPLSPYILISLYPYHPYTLISPLLYTHISSIPLSLCPYLPNLLTLYPYRNTLISLYPYHHK